MEEAACIIANVALLFGIFYHIRSYKKECEVYKEIHEDIKKMIDKLERVIR